jgi:transmembrane sensor
MSAFRELSPDKQRRLEEAADWRLRLARDPTLEQSAEYIAWSADPVNVSARDAVREGWSAMGVIDTAPEILELRRQALTRLRRSASAGRWSTRKFATRAAAAVVAIVAVGTGAYYARCYLATYLPTSYETPIGERRVIALPDGSRMSMDSDTKIRVSYCDTARIITLDRGRSRFDVAHDPNRPFTVTAGPETVVAVGTSFNVERLQASVLVTVIQGQVVVKNAVPPAQASTGTELAASVSLQPGEQFVAARNIKPAIVPADLQVVTAWETGHLVFRDEPLGSAVARVNRYTAHPVIIDPSITSIRISGVFNAGDTGSFVSAVTSYLPVQATTTAGNDILLQPRS